jgi:hypothetical protein
MKSTSRVVNLLSEVPFMHPLFSMTPPKRQGWHSTRIKALTVRRQTPQEEIRSDFFCQVTMEENWKRIPPYASRSRAGRFHNLSHML